MNYDKKKQAARKQSVVHGAVRKGSGFASGWSPTTAKKFSPDVTSPMVRHRASIAARSKKVKVTLATTPWDDKEDRS